MSTQDSTHAKLERDLQEKTPVVSAETHAADIRAEAHTLTAKETLSAYFTIAAAAFGLISDGCK
jgi:hypothetical protein